MMQSHKVKLANLPAKPSRASLKSSTTGHQLSLMDLLTPFAGKARRSDAVDEFLKGNNRTELSDRGTTTTGSSSATCSPSSGRGYSHLPRAVVVTPSYPDGVDSDDGLRTGGLDSTILLPPVDSELGEDSRVLRVTYPGPRKSRGRNPFQLKESVPLDESRTTVSSNLGTMVVRSPTYPKPDELLTTSNLRTESARHSQQQQLHHLTVTSKSSYLPNPTFEMQHHQYYNDSTSYTIQDMPVSERRSSQAIAIKRSSSPLSYNQPQSPAQSDCGNDDERLNENMYEFATWRMYNRIVDHRRNQTFSTSSSSKTARSSNEINRSTAQVPSLHLNDDLLDGEIFDMEL